MQKPAKVQDKYFLRAVHQDIDLLDRKLAHAEKFDTFETKEARDAALSKIAASRELLAKTARRLASEGITYHEAELPRSFRATAESQS